VDLAALSDQLALPHFLVDTENRTVRGIAEELFSWVGWIIQ